MGISISEFRRRYAAIRRAMKSEKMDCLLIVGSADDFNRGNIRYVTGSGRGGCCVMGPEGAPIFIVAPNQLSNPKLRVTLEAFDLLELREADDLTEGVIREVSRWYQGNRIGLIGRNCISLPMYLAIQDRFGKKLIDASHVLERLREIKSPEEIEKIRMAATVADSVYGMLRKTIKAGMGEFQIYASVKKMAYEMGCEYSFDLIDADGSSMNMSFYPTSDKLVAHGTLFMEITPAFQGYYAQLPVTLPVDSYRPQVRKMVEAWRAADSAARAVLRPGTKVSELYRILIDTVREQGFNSPYRPGHAIGLDALDFWSITATNERLLKPGMVLAVHPSVLSEFGGDGCGMGYTYLITDTGVERFSKIDLAADLLGK